MTGTDVNVKDVRKSIVCKKLEHFAIKLKNCYEVKRTSFLQITCLLVLITLTVTVVNVIDIRKYIFPKKLVRFVNTFYLVFIK